MNETTMDDPTEWVWQGFYGPMPAAAAAIAATYADARVGACAPLPVEGVPPAPMPVDVDGEDGMFAVMTRRGDPVPKPAGMRQADPAMVGRMVGG